MAGGEGVNNGKKLLWDKEYFNNLVLRALLEKKIILAMPVHVPPISTCTDLSLQLSTFKYVCVDSISVFVCVGSNFHVSRHLLANVKVNVLDVLDCCCPVSESEHCVAIYLIFEPPFAVQFDESVEAVYI